MATLTFEIEGAIEFATLCEMLADDARRRRVTYGWIDIAGTIDFEMKVDVRSDLGGMLYSLSNGRVGEGCTSVDEATRWYTNRVAEKLSRRVATTVRSAPMVEE